MNRVYTVAGRSLSMTRLEKELWPGEYTKADLVAYYLTVADTMIPHVRGRPASVTRWPDGITGKMFFQKNAPPHCPEWITTWTEDGTRYLVINEPGTLAFLANLAALEIHTWLSRVPATRSPDIAVIDLDPTPPCGFGDARRVAALVKAALDTLGLVGFLKTSGATGLHIYLPLGRRATPEAVRNSIRELGRALQAAAPDFVTLEPRVRNRHGVYVDFGQNSAHRTMAAPYSPRPLPGAPVSTPIRWDELSQCHPCDFTIRTVPRRLKESEDPWRDFDRVDQDISCLQRL
jgi:bifunctional non-homologous end joining protein LigD